MIINWGDAPFKAFITVTYPNGSCTVSLGDKSFTHSGGGTHTFTVTKKGTWTVTATRADGTSESSDVSISHYGQTVNVTLTCPLVVFDGADNTEVTGGWIVTKGVAHNGIDAGTHIVVQDNLLVAWGSSESISLRLNEYSTNNSIDMTGYSRLKITVSSTQGVFTVYVGSVSMNLVAGDNVVDISSVSDSQPIKLSTEATSSVNTSAGPTKLQVSSMVLE